MGNGRSMHCEVCNKDCCYKCSAWTKNGCSDCWNDWKLLATMGEPNQFTPQIEEAIKCLKCSHAYKFHYFKDN